MNQPQTPLEKLISDKARIQAQCKQQEQVLNTHFGYLQANAGSLLLSGMSALLFPKSKPGAPSTVAKAEAPSTPLGLSDYLSLAKGMTPVLWEVVQPLIVAWGVKKAKTMLLTLFTKKKRRVND